MTDQDFRVIMDYAMATDPHPSDHVATSGTDAALQAILNREATARGYESWYVAYHEHQPIVVEA